MPFRFLDRCCPKAKSRSNQPAPKSTALHIACAIFMARTCRRHFPETKIRQDRRRHMCCHDYRTAMVISIHLSTEDCF